MAHPMVFLTLENVKIRSQDLYPVIALYKIKKLNINCKTVACKYCRCGEGKSC